MGNMEPREPDGQRHVTPTEAPIKLNDEPQLGPAQPSEEVRAELEAFLDADQTRIGEVFRGLRRGLSADQIAQELGVETSNFVWNYDKLARALAEGELPTAPTVALAAARKFRAVLKTARLCSTTPTRHQSRGVGATSER